MTDLQIVLVQRTFRYLQPIGDTVAELFYRRLGELEPRLARVCPAGAQRSEGRKLLQMLAVGVAGLRDTERMAGVLAAFGRDNPALFTTAGPAVVGQALLDTFHVALGDAFSRDVYQAWTAAYAALGPHLVRGATQAEAPGP